MNGYIIALDQGTTSSRSIIFDSKGNIVSLAQYPFTQVNTESINLGTLPTVPPSFTPEPATSADHSTTATPVEPAKPTVEEKKNETKPATNPMFGPTNSNLDVDIPDLSFPSFD